MAGRPVKKRIDYAGWSVDIFDNDTKIDKLLDAQGWQGFGIYFYLCQRAYGSEGYYYPWSYTDSATTARKMGGGVGSETVKHTVDTCLQIGLFDKRLFDRDGVLTSRGIQKRYWAAIADRPRKLIRSDIWLLTNDEAPGCVACMLDSDLSPTNTDLLPNESNYVRLKESKGKESKGKQSKGNIIDGPGFARLWDAYPRKIDEDDARAVFSSISPDDDLVTEMVEIVEAWAACEGWTERGGRFVPSLKKWLSERRWEQGLPVNKNAKEDTGNGAETRVGVHGRNQDTGGKYKEPIYGDIY